MWKVAALAMLQGIFFGCASSRPPTGLSEALPAGSTDSHLGEILIAGWVKNAYWYPFKQGLTVSDAIALAGGYPACEGCDNLPFHPCDSRPVDLWRSNGKHIKVPPAKRRTFLLQPGDRLSVQHNTF
jgi:hypothetical protein